MTKFPALKQNLNLKTRYEQLDFDYIHKLNDKEKAWLNAFVEEEIHANLNHPGKKLNKLKRDRLRIYNKNNARNRDILTRCNASGRSVSMSDLDTNIGTRYELEKIVYNIDRQRKEERLQKRRSRIKTSEPQKS